MFSVEDETEEIKSFRNMLDCKLFFRCSMHHWGCRLLNYISNSMHNTHNICMNCFLLTGLCPTGFSRRASIPLQPCKSISCCVLLDFQNVKPALLEMQHLE